MNVIEEALLFPCAGELLPGIVARPESPGGACHYGVLVIVGGPQYRAGSHRQFVLLSRRLAGEGFRVMRFDHRGMGDGSGEMRSFEAIGEDIAAAIDAFQRACPSVTRIVLWGLCDAAAAALLYVHSTGDARVAGLALLNPWVRSEVSLAQTQIKHYYGQRLLQREFWHKLLSGRLEVCRALRGLLEKAIVACRQNEVGRSGISSFQQRMASGWRGFSGQILLILSGQDHVAKEFLGFTGACADWLGLIEASRVCQVVIDDADHTFSCAAWRTRAENATLVWLHTLAAT